MSSFSYPVINVFLLHNATSVVFNYCLIIIVFIYLFIYFFFWGGGIFLIPTTFTQTHTHTNDPRPTTVCQTFQIAVVMQMIGFLERDK